MKCSKTINIMDLLKTPSVQSLLDSDLESVDSFPYLDVEELDEVEYALPSSEAPTLAEVLSTDDDDVDHKLIFKIPKTPKEPTTCSALQIDFLQAVSQQLLQAQERSSAGAATTLSIGKDGKLTVGTAHGHLLTFHDQVLRWVCDSNTDKGAVSSLAYNQDSSRLLAGYARGLVCQYESVKGVILRRVMLGCDIWGTLKVTWAGTSALALDTGGSVWLIKFSRPLGVRSAKTSCLFSGARGEVVAMTARDARILALATLSRVIVVAGGRASGVRLGGPPDTLPVLEWCENSDRVLVCARARMLQWISVNITGSTISLRPMQRVELKRTPLWLGWLGGSLAIFDVDENLRLWGDDYDKPLDLSHIEPVYASAFFKGVWTDGRVSRAMCMAGVSALGGACVSDGILSILGRRGVLRVKPRDPIARAQAFIASGQYLQALRLLCSTKEPEAAALANSFISILTERPYILGDKNVADQTIKLCVKYNLSENLWGTLWEHCSREKTFVEALGDAAVRGDLTDMPPSPDSTQELIEKLADIEPGLVERVVASLPLTSLDPHRASVFTRERRLWRGVGAIAAALGGPCGAIHELIKYVNMSCGVDEAACSCSGAALLLAAADALAGRCAGGRALPDHARPAARRRALHALLDTEAGIEGQCPLRVLVQHEATAAIRLLEQCARDPPFAGPLAKQNRLKVARSLLTFTQTLEKPEDRTEILEFITGQLSSGALPADQEVIKATQELAINTEGERADRALVTLATRVRAARDLLQAARAAAAGRPRVLWRLDARLDKHEQAVRDFFQIPSPSDSDVDEFFDYLRNQVEDSNFRKSLEPQLSSLVKFRPRAIASIVNDHFPDSVLTILNSREGEHAIEFAEFLLDVGQLKGDAAAAHLKNLCKLKPTNVPAFLKKNSGVVRPEDALNIVREAGIIEAEAICLEATGDPEGALNALLKLIAIANENGDEEESERVISLACAVCSGAAAADGAALWRALLAAAPGRPALLLAAAPHLPAHHLISNTCNSPEVAMVLLECAANQHRLWKCTARIAGLERHTALSRALMTSQRGTAVRGLCTRCNNPLSSNTSIRTTHCARAIHINCPAQQICVVCSRHLPTSIFTPPTKPQRMNRVQTTDHDHNLLLSAPPRPDLEGVV